MNKTCLLSGNFALDTIVVRDYPEGFTVGKNNRFTETVVAESVGNTCGNVSCMLQYLGVRTFPIGHFDLSPQGLKMKDDLARYGADDWTTLQLIACLCEKGCLSVAAMTSALVRECLQKASETASHSVSFMASKGMIDAGN